jgi:hypothetical protein
MTINFKFSDALAEGEIDRVVRDLEGKGIRAEKLFPGQKRPALSRVYLVNVSGRSNIEKVEQALMPYKAELDYVEEEVSRELKSRINSR